MGLILVIEFFQRSLQVGLDDAGDPALLAGAVALVSLALALSALTDRKAEGDAPTGAPMGGPSTNGSTTVPESRVA